MFDIGWQELFIVGILAIIVVGPKDLPRTLRAIMGLVRKARMLARDFQDGIDEVVREADLDDMKKQIDNISDSDIEKTISDAIDPDGGLAGDLDMTEITDDMDKSAKESTAIDDKAAKAARDGKAAKAARDGKAARAARDGKAARAASDTKAEKPETLAPSADAPADTEDKKDEV